MRRANSEKLQSILSSFIFWFVLFISILFCFLFFFHPFFSPQVFYRSFFKSHSYSFPFFPFASPNLFHSFIQYLGDMSSLMYSSINISFTFIYFVSASFSLSGDFDFHSIQSRPHSFFIIDLLIDSAPHIFLYKSTYHVSPRNLIFALTNLDVSTVAFMKSLIR